MMAPVLVGVASTSSKAVGGESAGNRRLRPPPATTGLITRGQLVQDAGVDE